MNESEKRKELESLVPKPLSDDELVIVMRGGRPLESQFVQDAAKLGDDILRALGFGTKASIAETIRSYGLYVPSSAKVVDQYRHALEQIDLETLARICLWEIKSVGLAGLLGIRRPSFGARLAGALARGEARRLRSRGREVAKVQTARVRKAFQQGAIPPYERYEDFPLWGVFLDVDHEQKKMSWSALGQFFLKYEAEARKITPQEVERHKRDKPPSSGSPRESQDAVQKITTTESQQQGGEPRMSDGDPVKNEYCAFYYSEERTQPFRYDRPSPRGFRIPQDLQKIKAKIHAELSVNRQIILLEGKFGHTGVGFLRFGGPGASNGKINDLLERLNIPCDEVHPVSKL